MTFGIVHKNAPVVRSSTSVTLIGGGHVTQADIQKALTLAPVCVAADGGASHALAAGLVPDAVIGDMDSLNAHTRAQLDKDRLYPIAEQDSTDFEKCLRNIAAPAIIGVGFCGGRIDHQLAAFHSLLAYAQIPCVLLAGAEIVFLAPAALELPCASGDVVSLFPLVPVRARSVGLEWPIDDVLFDPKDKIGTSNRAIGPVSLTFDGPGMLVIAKADLIQPVVQQLSERAARWPVL